MRVRSPKVAAYLIGIVALALFLATPVSAEYYRNSAINNWDVGTNSRDFNDNIQDGYATDLFLSGCISTYGNYVSYVRMNLWHVFPFYPDQNIGGNDFYCSNYDHRYWGNEDSGTYHFTLSAFTTSQGNLNTSEADYQWGYSD